MEPGIVRRLVAILSVVALGLAACTAAGPSVPGGTPSTPATATLSSLTPLPSEDSFDTGDSSSSGTATLTLDAPASASVTLPIGCQWRSKTHVLFYSFNSDPFELLGEQVWLSMGDWSYVGGPGLQISRQELAEYTGRGATFQSEGFGTGAGFIRFTKLTPDPESYRFNEPLPSPIGPFIKPLGGNEAARSLSGTLQWRCDEAPAGVPDVEPSLGPIPTSSVVWPMAVLAVEGRTDSLMGSPQCSMNWVGPDGLPIGGQGQCGGPTWILPTASVNVEVGAKLTISMPGFAVAPAVIAATPTSRVKYFRGGEPDQFITLAQAESPAGSLSCYAPPRGDWVIVLQIRALAADGASVDGRFLFHIVVE